MEDLYALYLFLFAINRAGDGPAFTSTVHSSIVGFDNVAKSIEVYATAAIAVSDILLDYYDFQQRWDRFRSIAPRQ